MIDPSTRFFTPAPYLEAVAELGPILLDPCADPLSCVDADRAIMLPEHLEGLGVPPDEARESGVVCGDALEIPWIDLIDEHTTGGVVFVNPPYGRSHNATWGSKIQREAEFIRRNRFNVQTVALVPASTGAAWFEKYWDADALCFVQGRIAFDKVDGSDAVEKGKFDSVFAYWGHKADEFRYAFEKFGQVVRPR